MSFIANDPQYPIYIDSGVPHSWVWTWHDAGWQENTFIQPEPVTTGASMSYTDPTVSRNSNGKYSFAFTVINDGPASTFYDLRINNN
jgi:hypothetical protein